MPIRMDFREYALSSRKSEGKRMVFYRPTHAQGAVSELRLATDLSALQGCRRIELAAS